MKIDEFERLLLNELQQIVENIIHNHQQLNISAQARSGAEISDWIEDKFVEYTQVHQYFKNSESAPKGATKNPWDARTYFVIDSINELIWIDFKAIKITGIGSNPDIGSPNKIIEFIKSGNFYMTYIYVYYRSQGSGIEFVKLENTYSKVYFLKDISNTVRRNPKNQLQINISENPQYRRRSEFIELLICKLKESHQRQIDISTRTLEKLDKIQEELMNANELSESSILENLKRLD